MKILYPHKQATVEEIEEVLRFAIEVEKRVKDQLMRIDQTYATVRFSFTSQGAKNIWCKRLKKSSIPRSIST